MNVGSIPAEFFDGQANLTRGSLKEAGALHLAEILDLMQAHRVPSNIESAAFTATANDEWEDVDVVTLLNAALQNDSIRADEAVQLLCTLEVINGEAAVNNIKYAHGDTPDNDDTVRTFATAAAAGSEFIQGVVLITDGSGQIKFETDDIANVTVKVHLEGFQYVKKTAAS